MRTSQLTINQLFPGTLVSNEVQSYCMGHIPLASNLQKNHPALANANEYISTLSPFSLVTNVIVTCFCLFVYPLYILNIAKRAKNIDVGITHFDTFITHFIDLRFCLHCLLFLQNATMNLLVNYDTIRESARRRR